MSLKSICLHRARALRAPDRERGVTLIELMVTVAVLVVIVALGAPSMSAFLERRAVDGVTEQFASDIRLARTEAMKRGMTVSVCVRSEAVNNGVSTLSCAAAQGARGFANGWLVFSDVKADGSYAASEGDSLIKDQQAASNLVTSMLENSGAVSYTLQNTGIMAGASGHITVLPASGTSQQRVGCVIINFAGRARIETGKSSCS